LALAQDKLGFFRGGRRESVSPIWKDDTSNIEPNSLDEIQTKDPLTTQIWRLYSKTKKQLPDQERMESFDQAPAGYESTESRSKRMLLGMLEFRNA
jgi:hypothetical protein